MTKTITSVVKLYDANSNLYMNAFHVTWSDGTVSQVPETNENYHYMMIQEWVDAGNTITDNPPE